MNIRYEFVTGEIVEIEVPDDIGEVSITIDREIQNSNRRETRRHNYIIEMEHQGIQIPDNSQDVHKIIEQQQTSQSLHAALDTLLPHQKELVFAMFFEGRSITNLAREQGVTEGAIRNRLKKIYNRLKNILD